MRKIQRNKIWKVVFSFFISSVFFFSSCQLTSAKTLKQTLAIAHKNSRSLRADQVSARASNEDVSLARSGYMPTISVQGQYSYNNAMEYSTVGSVGIQLEHKIFDGFITRNSVAAAKAKVKSQREFLRNSEQNLLLEAVKAHAELYAARQIVSLRQETLSALKAQMQAVRARLQVGEGTQTDLAQSEAGFSLAMSLFYQANADVKARNAVYQRIVGIEAGMLEQPSQINDLPQQLTDSLHYALQNHPAILYAQYVAESASYMVRAQQGARLPQVTAKAGASYNEVYRGYSVGGQSSSVSLQLSIPVFQGGGISAQVRQLRELATQAQIEVMMKQEQVREQLVSSWSHLEGAKAAVEAYKDSVRASQIALNGRIQENLVGQATTLDVLNSRAMVIDSQINLFLAERDAIITSYAVKVAMGQLSIASLRL